MLLQQFLLHCKRGPLKVCQTITILFWVTCFYIHSCYGVWFFNIFFYIAVKARWRCVHVAIMLYIWFLSMGAPKIAFPAYWGGGGRGKLTRQSHAINLKWGQTSIVFPPPPMQPCISDITYMYIELHFNILFYIHSCYGVWFFNVSFFYIANQRYLNTINIIILCIT
jgi:hypothetical protein